MAAAEARAAWQRTANRCFVQEDAKRAPKLACCPSSSSSKVQPEASEGDSTNRAPAANFMPLNWNPANSGLPADTKWWLQLQPNFAYQKDFTSDQLNAVETELRDAEGDIVSTSELSGEPLPTEESGFCSLDSQWRSTTCMKHDADTRLPELKAVSSNIQQPLKPKADMAHLPYQDEELMNWEHIDRLISKPEKNCSDQENAWIRGDKMEPWWRTADQDELAFLVAQKSLEHIENCDLPRPRSTHVRRGAAGLESFSPSLDLKIHAGPCNPTGNAWPASGSTDIKHWSSSGGRSLYDSEKLCSYSTANKDPTESSLSLENDPSKTQLLEALRHSQTRAREAEKAAQQAYTEKEHIVKLFFRQASQLFAYKQWLQLLQLETLCLQLKTKDHQISSLFPGLPWMPSTKRRKTGHKAKRKGATPKCDFCKYAFAFAVGLGLAGAGVLLGWTMGWLFPTL